MTTTSSATGGLSALNTLMSSLSSGSSTSSTSSSSSSSSSSTSTGTGLLSSAGIGSGLDVTAIITALVNAQQAGPQAQIAAQAQQDQNLESGLSGLSSALSSLQSAMNAVGTSFSSYTATLSDTIVGTATAANGATPGTYDIQVNSLATAQKRVSGAYTSGSAVGSGALNVTVGSSTMNISVSSTSTLADIASSINSASNNPGVTATVLNGTGGQQLVLSSNNTGTANAFTVTAASGSSSGLSSLASTLNTAGSSEASDAQYTIDGVAMSSSSNTVGSALSGVVLNFAATGSTKLTVAQDNSGITSAVQSFVSAYNQYASTIGVLSSYDSSTGSAGLLLGNSTLLSAENQISSVLGSQVGGNALQSLANIGITRNADGTMSLDSQTFSAALSSNPSAMQSLFTGTNGFVSRLSSTVDTFTGANGTIPQQISNLNNDLSNLNNQVTQLNSRMDEYKAQLNAQYTNLDTMMSQLNNTSSYLTQSMAAISGTSTSSSSSKSGG